MRGLIVIAIAACGTRLPRPPSPPVTITAPLVTVAYPGESAEFLLSFRGFAVGRAHVVVGTPGVVDDRRVVIYRSHGETEGLVTLLGHVRWELETTIDLDRAVAVRDREDTYIGTGDDVEYILREHAHDTDNLQHDIQSAVAAIRGWKSRPGDRVSLDMVFASVRVDIDLWDAGRGYTESRLVPAVRYEGTIDGDTGFVAWMSDDADRVPLEVRIASQYGEILIELVEYRAPRPAIEEKARVSTAEASRGS
jgi:hypothetical protein